MRAHRLEWWGLYALNRRMMYLGLSIEAGGKETVRGSHLLLWASLWGMVYAALGGRGLA